jgi:hypothetical protein
MLAQCGCNVGFVVRTRVMCQAGRAGGLCDDIVAWLCERAHAEEIAH